MPYQILFDNNIPQIALTGRVTGDDLNALVVETANYERNTIIPHRVTDMSEISESGVAFPMSLRQPKNGGISDSPTPSSPPSLRRNRNTLDMRECFKH